MLCFFLGAICILSFLLIVKEYSWACSRVHTFTSQCVVVFGWSRWNSISTDFNPCQLTMKLWRPRRNLFVDMHLCILITSFIFKLARWLIDLPHATVITRSVRNLTHVKLLGLSLAAANATHLPLDVLIEEERRQDYDPKHFYSVKLGEIFHDKYEVVVKVGFGGGSTVWLTRNLQRYVFSLNVTWNIVEI